MLAGRERELGCGGTPALSEMLPRLDATESARAKPGGDATLHLFTLSDRFIMALCTNPPIPLVGEAERVGDVRPSVRVGDRSGDRVSTSAGGSNRGEDAMSSIEPPVLLFRSGAGVKPGPSALEFDDMPGNCERAEDTSDRSPSST